MIGEASETGGNRSSGNRGGRPRKNIKRDEQLAVMCSLIERKIIEQKARMSGVSVSQFLRTLALNGLIDSKNKALPREVLQLTATLNHMAANLNQLARKNNREEPFSAAEKAEFGLLTVEIKKLAEKVKYFLK